MITTSRLSAVLAAGAVALAIGVAAPSTAQAKSATGFSVSAGHGKSQLTLRFGNRQHLRGPISRSYIRTLKRGPWRITEKVTIARFPRLNEVRTNVVVLKRVWVGHQIRTDFRKRHFGTHAKRFQRRG